MTYAEAGETLRQEQRLTFGKLKRGEKVGKEVEDTGHGHSAIAQTQSLRGLRKAHPGWVPQSRACVLWINRQRNDAARGDKAAAARIGEALVTFAA